MAKKPWLFLDKFVYFMAAVKDNPYSFLKGKLVLQLLDTRKVKHYDKVTCGRYCKA